MRLRIVLLCMVLVLMASCVSAFPLTGGNGKATASVLGTITDGNYIDIDIVGDIFTGVVTLVDSDDKFYNADSEKRICIVGMTGSTLDTPGRCLYSVEVPAKVEIKRIRITPDKGDPFSIEWTGVPEVNNSLFGMKFYGLQTTQKSSRLKSWTIDVKVTNNENQKQTIDGTQIEIVDQFGYPYTGEFRQLDLMPKESARFNINVDMVSSLSRPVYLKYLPSNLTMDISAWA